MPRVLNLQAPYKIYVEEGDEVSLYYFITDQGTKYSISLIKSLEFDDYPFKDNLYEISFFPDKKSHRSDPKIKETIAAFILAFFQNTENILLFVADQSDGKHHARKRLFDLWKNEFDKNNDFTKLDIIFESEFTGTYYISVLYRNENSFSELIPYALEHGLQKYKSSK